MGFEQAFMGLVVPVVLEDFLALVRSIEFEA